METNDIKALLGIDEAETSKDGLISYVIDKTTEMIKNYCRIDHLPKGLESVAKSMAVELYRLEQPGREEAVGTAKSVSMGDMAVTFHEPQADAYPSATLISNMSGMTFLRNYTLQLDRYRKAGF